MGIQNVCFIFGIGVLFSAFAIHSIGQVSVEVSPIYSSISYSNSVSLQPDMSETFELPKPPQADEHKLVFAISNGAFRTIVFDRINVTENNPNPSFLLDRRVSGTNFIGLPRGPSNKGIVVTLWNESARSIFLNYTVSRIGRRSPQIVRQVKEIVEIPILAFAKFYKLPRFKVAVLPCGEVNAFSSPDITICSELIADLHEKDLADALYPIIYHEMAHTLLNLWNLPGFDNEDIADEFSAAMLGRVRPKFVESLISYLESNDSTTEAVVQLTAGSRHTLSIQRARNMRLALQKITQLETRWGNLLKPHAKPQTRAPKP